MTLTLRLSSQRIYTQQCFGNIMPHMFRENRIPVRQMQLKLLVACMITAQNGYLLQARIIPPPSCAYCHSIRNGLLTVERKASTCSIFAPPIFCHTFVSACVFLLEIRYFKDGVWILHLDFAGEGNAAGSPPAYFWDRAAKTNKTFPWWQLSVTVIKVWWSAEETKPEQEVCELLFPTNQSLIAQIFWRTLISAPLSFHVLRWIDGSKNEWCYACTLLIYLEKHHAWMSLQLISQVHTQVRPYFPRAKHSSFTADSFAAGTDSGKWTSILGSYSPITPTKRETVDMKHLIRGLHAH